MANFSFDIESDFDMMELTNALNQTQREISQRPESSFMPRPSELQRPEEKPVFVKIEQYKEAMQSIQQLKQKLKDIESSLQRVENIRAQEQDELKSCQDNLNKLKERLIAIDQKLFEV